MPRLFTALELPQPARVHLSLVRGELGAARWAAPENMHLTLRFFGDVDDAQADEIADRLEQIDADAVAVEIAGTGSFGGQGETAVYAAVRPSAPLAELQKRHERVARAVGLPAETRAYKPHVTLGAASDSAAVLARAVPRRDWWFGGRALRGRPFRAAVVATRSRGRAVRGGGRGAAQDGLTAAGRRTGRRSTPEACHSPAIQGMGFIGAVQSFAAPRVSVPCPIRSTRLRWSRPVRLRV